jgi:catechol 2,3-dioxygenase-like lactoylglutathione lyase family enzyme
MKSVLVLVVLGLGGWAFAGPGAPQRPKITNIDHVAFYTTAPEGVTHLYHDVIGLESASPFEPGETLRFLVGKQWVGYSPAPDPQVISRLDHVAFATDNAAALERYLGKKGVSVPDGLQRWPDGSHSFRVKDPEGNVIEFVQHPKGEPQDKPAAEAVSQRMIHAGFIVHDRAAEDAFYRDTLGFHVYWQGGMQPGRTDWCSMQVPDGTSWLEYMLNIPAQPERRQAGVMNHISLGVVSMKDTQAKLESHGWQPHGAEQAKIGRDGKWQLNLYDPDLTRVELMEFQPVEKSCCSEFQGTHPGPDR